ncbi:failed axon connections homolog isoform X1 [Palaemon carinicauda]|uniref:failed axon connections homolog isoform X1 n=1 Tax=Palaemon carinicauda TaxID=392227 RepID=UPI0035B68B14
MTEDTASASLWNCKIILPSSAILILATLFLYSKAAAKRRRTLWHSFGRDVVVLHCPSRGRFAPSMSPFVIKLESYLRLANISYKVDFDEPLSPKGKTPWVTLNGEDLTDSQLAMEILAKKFGKDMSSHLTDEQKAIARAFAVMMDEHLIWGIRVWRYDTDKCAGFAECMEDVPIALKVAMPLYRKKMMDALWYQGIGRHSVSEVIDIVRKDLVAISNHLGENSYLMGNEVSDVDCVMFAHLANIYYNYRRSPFYIMLKDLCNLEAYIHRLREQLWPDWGLCLQPPNYTRQKKSTAQKR